MKLRMKLHEAKMKIDVNKEKHNFWCGENKFEKKKRSVNFIINEQEDVRRYYVIYFHFDGISIKVPTRTLLRNMFNWWAS